MKLITLMTILLAVYGAYRMFVIEINEAPFINDDLTEKPDSGAQNSAK